MRDFFDKSFSWIYDSGTRSVFRNIYFGLGNHDVQTCYHPDVGWWKGFWLWNWSSHEDYWRCQMWNFICQMHMGDKKAIGRADPIYPVTTMDNDGKGGFDWTKYSFNYVVNLGPVDVYQVHVYGGDVENGRPSGIPWLNQQLSQRGTTRPVIIVQHYPFKDTKIEPNWTSQQRDYFLSVLEPYNVVALLTGHVHNELVPIPYVVPIPGSTTTFDEFRPGSCSDFGAFAVVQVTNTSLNIMQGNTTSGAIVWSQGYAKTWDFQGWIEDADPNGNYFPPGGGLTKIYADTNAVTCPTGMIVVGFAFYEKGNRIAPKLLCTNPDGTNPTWVQNWAPNDNYFPPEGGLTDFYADTTPIMCPTTGQVVIGVQLYRKGNRVAPALLCANPDWSNPQWVQVTDWNPNYFPPEGGLTDFYADTNVVQCPAGMVMQGIKFYQKGNRLAPAIYTA